MKGSEQHVCGEVTIDEVQRLVRDSAHGNATCEVRSLGPYANALTVGSREGERLEFVGDAMIGAVVAEYLFERFPSEREGFLSRMRSKMVNGAMLARLGEALGLGMHVRRGAGGVEETKVMEDVFEAFVGAMSVDVGIEAAKAWLLRFIEAHMDISALVSRHDTNKEQLARVQGAAMRPVYTELRRRARGADGDYVVSVCVRAADGTVLGSATAKSRKAAEEEAARRALVFYGNGPGDRALMLPRSAVGVKTSQSRVRVSCGQ